MHSAFIPTTVTDHTFRANSWTVKFTSSLSWRAVRSQTERSHIFDVRLKGKAIPPPAF